MSPSTWWKVYFSNTACYKYKPYFPVLKNKYEQDDYEVIIASSDNSCENTYIYA
jgi:hypothetical protein